MKPSALLPLLGTALLLLAALLLPSIGEAESSSNKHSLHKHHPAASFDDFDFDAQLELKEEDREESEEEEGDAALIDEAAFLEDFQLEDYEGEAVAAARPNLSPTAPPATERDASTHEGDTGGRSDLKPGAEAMAAAAAAISRTILLLSLAAKATAETAARTYYYISAAAKFAYDNREFVILRIAAARAAAVAVVGHIVAHSVAFSVEAYAALQTLLARDNHSLGRGLLDCLAGCDWESRNSGPRYI